MGLINTYEEESSIGLLNGGIRWNIVLPTTPFGDKIVEFFGLDEYKKL